MGIAKDYSRKALYDLLKSYVWPYISPLIITVLVSTFSPYVDKFAQIPRLYVGAAVVSLIVIVIIGKKICVRGYKFFRRRYLLLFHSGLFYYNKNDTIGDNEENRNMLQEEAVKANTIELIGATGWNTFSKNNASGSAILRDAFEQAQGDINIVLLDPTKACARERADSIGMDWVTYENEIKSSIAFLKGLRDKKKRVSLKFYNQKPVWKMIRLDGFLWLQYYHPDNHVEKMPVYGIKRTPEKDEHSLFDPLYSVFEKKWKHDDNPKFDFENDQIIYPNGSKLPYSL